MSLSILFELGDTTQALLDRPPPIPNNRWMDYKPLTPLLGEKHGMIIALLKEEIGDLSQTYDTDLPQSYLDEVFHKGARYTSAINIDLRRLSDVSGTVKVDDYIFALTLLKENLDGTIRFYFRIRGVC